MRIRTFEAFAGYGSQLMALKRLSASNPELEIEPVGISEIDKNAIKAYQAVHGDVRNYGDISRIDWAEVPDFDLFTYSFPCGLQGTMVKTITGYKDISQIVVGEKVLTHNNRYRKVVRTTARNVPEYYYIKATGAKLRLTGGHPLYVLRDGKEQWVRVCDLETTDKISYCIPHETTASQLSENELWMLGRYVADGWVNPLLYNSVEFAIAFKKEDEFVRHIPKNWDMRKFRKNCWEYRIANREFRDLALGFGNGSQNKQIPEWVLDLPVEQLMCFLDGYFSGDGHIRFKNGVAIQMFTTVSKSLFLGLQLCLLKAYHKVCSLSVRKDNRKETFSDSYNGQLAFSEKTAQVIVGDRVFVPIRSIVKVSEAAVVYNLEVTDDNSYTCDNVNSHNCTDLSSAGKQQGVTEGSGTRSSLLWECRRAIAEKRPKWLLMENVTDFVGQKFIAHFNRWEQWLASLGYDNFGKILNATDFGVPQNRQRIFLVSILGEHPFFTFPKGVSLDRRLKDVLEPEVDEKFFLSDKQVRSLVRYSDRKQSEGCGFKVTFRGGGQDISSTILAGYGRKRTEDTYLKCRQYEVAGTGD